MAVTIDQLRNTAPFGQIDSMIGVDQSGVPLEGGPGSAISALGGTSFLGQGEGGTATGGGTPAAPVDPFAFRDPTTGLSFETNAPPLGAQLPAGQGLPPGFMQDPATGALELSGSQNQPPGGGTPPAEGGGAAQVPGGTFGEAPDSAISALGGTQAQPGEGPVTPGAVGQAPGDFSQITSAMDLLSNPSTLDTLKAQSASNTQVKSQLDSLIKSLQGLGG